MTSMVDDLPLFLRASRPADRKSPRLLSSDQIVTKTSMSQLTILQSDAWQTWSEATLYLALLPVNWHTQNYSKCNRHSRIIVSLKIVGSPIRKNDGFMDWIRLHSSHKSTWEQITFRFEQCLTWDATYSHTCLRCGVLQRFWISTLKALTHSTPNVLYSVFWSTDNSSRENLP